MKHKKSSRRWLDRHFNDEYVKQAQKEGYRSRAAFKLLEVQERDRLLKPGQVVVDLGAAPGGWSQIARKLVGKGGRVVALDMLEMEPLPDVECLCGDFREEKALKALTNLLAGDQVDLVISDMAPNVTGVASVDQPRAMYLCELALEFANAYLKPGGGLLVKVFQGEGFDGYVLALREVFGRVVTRKPAASRAQSREVYLVGSNFRG